MELNFLNRTWKWNPDDTRLLQVNDWIKDLYTALAHVPRERRGVAIQAGGAMGVWPDQLSEYFQIVHTFEPHPVNFDCLRANVGYRANVEMYNAALGSYTGVVEIKLPDSEQHNAGAYYTVKHGKGEAIPQFQLDEMVRSGQIKGRVDFIQLDVEGHEMDVLLGAIEILTNDAPVLMLEDKPLPQDAETGHTFGEVEKWLCDEMGYRVAQRVHRDIILVPGG